MEKTKKILIVVTNTSDSGDLHKTGVWLEEFAVPYYAFQDEGYEVTVASPLGGVAPIDENSLECKNPSYLPDGGFHHPGFYSLYGRYG